jgi:hypothetical protein
MVSVSELSLNVVNPNKLKMLPSGNAHRAWAKMARSRVRGVAFPSSWNITLPADREDLSCSLSFMRNLVSLYNSSTGGRKAARPTQGDAGKG